MVKGLNIFINNQEKVNRKYRLTVQLTDDNDNPTNKAIVITNPFTLNFNINRSIFAEINGADIEILNLAYNTYRELFWDYYSIGRRTVILEAGYDEKNMSVIFIGDLWSCYTSREGTETVTRMHCLVGLKARNIQTDATLANVSRFEILKYAANDMALGIKIYSGEDTKLSRPVSISGNSYGILQKYSDQNAFIDNNEIKVLAPYDTFEGYVPVIDDNSGLLGVPEHEDAILTVRMIFEPRLVIGQIIEIKSQVAPMFNGQYKIYGIRHEGTISDAVSGKATTTLEMLIGSQVYGKFSIKSPQ